MRVTLEWTDVLQILGEHFGRPLEGENVTVRTEPFELEISGVESFADLRAASARPTGRLSQSDVSAPVQDEADEITTDVPSRPRPVDSDIFTTLQQAREIERELNKIRR